MFITAKSLFWIETLLIKPYFDVLMVWPMMLYTSTHKRLVLYRYMITAFCITALLGYSTHSIPPVLRLLAPRIITQVCWILAAWLIFTTIRGLFQARDATYRDTFLFKDQLRQLRYMLPITTTEWVHWVGLSVCKALVDEYVYRLLVPKYLHRGLSGLWNFRFFVWTCTYVPGVFWICESYFYGGNEGFHVGIYGLFELCYFEPFFG